MKKVSRKKIVYSVIILTVIALSIFFYISSRKPAEISVIEVKRADLTQEVAVSGTVKAKEAVELAFEKSGRVKTINADVGDKVWQGNLLIALENGVEASSVDDAKAKLASKQASYDNLKKGGSAEEINVKETELAKAKSDLSTNYAEAQNIILDAYNKADNAIHRQADILFSNPFSTNPLINFNSSDQQSILDSQNSRYAVEGVFNNFKKLIQEPLTDNIEIENALVQTKKYLLSVNDFLIKTNKTLNSALNLSDTTLSTDKDALNTARTNINTAVTNVTDQIQAITTQKITVETAENQLELTKVGATSEVLSGALADIQSAEANVKNAQAVLAKTYIFSPISGIVTRQDAKVGQIAGANTTLVAVSSDKFKIEAFVPEVDVAKINTGNPATITLDAYGSGISFGGQIIKIDPAETVIDGVSTYKITLEFDKYDSRIRSGMTANITIVSAERKDVLNISQRAIYEKNGKKFVRVSTAKSLSEEREVSIGIKGSNGNIEIINGLTEGEKVIASGKQ